MANPAAALARHVADLERRLRSVERASQLAHASIETDDGESLDLLDSLLEGIAGAQNGRVALVDASVAQTAADDALDAAAAAQAAADSAIADAAAAQIAANNAASTASAAQNSANNAQATADAATTTANAASAAANNIGPTQITDDAILTRHVLAGAITAGELAAAAVVAGKIAANAVTAGTIEAGAVVAGKIAANAVTAATIATGQVQAGHIAAAAVQAGNIAAGAIQTADLAAVAVTSDKIAANAIAAGHISAGAVTADKIAATAIDGKTITGAVIRTAASGTRLEMNALGADPDKLLLVTGHASETSAGSLFAASASAATATVTLRSPSFSSLARARLDLVGAGGVNPPPSALSVPGALELTAASIKASVAFDLLTTWTAPTFAANFANFDGGFHQAGYMRDSSGVVHLRGTVKWTNATASSGSVTIFTLPADLRPSSSLDHIFVTATNAGGSFKAARVNIRDTGEVQFDANSGSLASGQWVSLDGISFRP